MPTGYTAKLVEEGQSFEEFIWRCARNFGACIMMRDDPLDVLPKLDGKVDDWNARRLEEVKTELLRLENMTDYELRTFGLEQINASIDRMKESQARIQLEDERIHEMLRRVKSWDPPMDDHKGLKDFMIQQLTISLNNFSYDRDIVEWENKIPIDVGREMIEQAKRNVSYYSIEVEKEKQRNAGRLVWLLELNKSVPQPRAA